MVLKEGSPNGKRPMPEKKQLRYNKEIMTYSLRPWKNNNTLSPKE